MTSLPGWRLVAPRLLFDPALPSRSSDQAYRGLRQHGPYDASELDLGDGSLLFVFPASEQPLARSLAQALLTGAGNYPGFAKLFRTDVQMGDALKQLSVPVANSGLASLADRYREAILQWNAQSRPREPSLAVVLVPGSDRADTRTPYYEAKAAFANLGIPTQMVRTELLSDPRQFGWAVANIALAMFAKLGGTPWAVTAPANDDDLIVGVGRADVGRGDERRRFFGYAVTFVANGIYRSTHSIVPTADEDQYGERMLAAIENALRADLDQPPSRLVIHLSKKAGRREIDAAEAAIASVGLSVPVAYLRLDDSSLHDLADVDDATYAPPKGIVAKLGPRRALLQAEELGNTGPPDGPLLIDLDRRSTVAESEFDELVAQVFCLAHANWRGFNARSRPATLVYGEQLASLVGHLQDVSTWNPDLVRPELRSRPWFL